MIVGIVGCEGAKFYPVTENLARLRIWSILTQPNITGFSSGKCHLGGIDVWAEAYARYLNIPCYIYAPTKLNWSEGYKPRNIKIATISDVVHCITLKELPKHFSGMRFEKCYHCDSTEHIKSGGCWTVKYAIKLGKQGIWHVL